jgi:hypothetical protein
MPLGNSPLSLKSSIRKLNSVMAEDKKVKYPLVEISFLMTC